MCDAFGQKTKHRYSTHICITRHVYDVILLDYFYPEAYLNKKKKQKESDRISKALFSKRICFQYLSILIKFQEYEEVRTIYIDTSISMQ